MHIDSPISTIMTTNVKCVSPSQKLVDIKHIYEQRNFHHHIPVTQDKKLVGIVSLIDFVRRLNDAGLDDNEAVYQKLSAADIMTRNPFYVTSDTSIKEVSQILAKGEFHAIIVVDNNAVSGIVSSSDVIQYLLDSQ